MNRNQSSVFPSRDKSITGARAAWSLDEDAKRRQPGRAEDGVVPFRAWEGESAGRNGLETKGNMKNEIY